MSEPTKGQKQTACVGFTVKVCECGEQRIVVFRVVATGRRVFLCVACEMERSPETLTD